MKSGLLLLVMLLVGLGTYAQIEIPRTTNTGGLLKAEPESKSGFPLLKAENPKESKYLKTDKAKKIDFRETNDELITAGEVVEKKWKKERDIKNAHKENQYLGDFTTSGKFVELYARDHEYVDGDKVRVIINGVEVQRITLGAGYHPVLAKLASGFNNIEFEALNQGTSGPNTAELKVLDEEGKLVTTKVWNLLTGAKASLIVVKK
ncbi:hypothetical protein [Salegentibacter sediminis]|uniref:hypothetical protein n=1 Tax=Salegentibacter sediminis TaxID=1930251 RepID=UPI0009BD0274|nr:hypothetical protein [Salegentibacter sediminis]